MRSRPALASEPPARRAGAYALVVSRLAPEKGVDVAIDACRLAGMPLVIAGDGPERAALQRARSAAAEVRFVGRVDDAELAALRAGAAIALVPSRSAETFGLAAAEAMAAGLPVVGEPRGRAAGAGRRARARRRRATRGALARGDRAPGRRPRRGRARAASGARAVLRPERVAAALARDLRRRAARRAEQP